MWRCGRNEERVEQERDFAPDGDVGILECITENVPTVDVVHLLHCCGVVLQQARECVDGFRARLP